ncbi:unnamed protein product [Enterobius vermicularis]|uniref:ENTH domain-containing protein n=1 Tax=Enterobius vermicularis TaxID=51028 RepID=A0A0N4V4H3_ENTVE|nr:unnamed protein product [Enterobius vermicularis]
MSRSALVSTDRETFYKSQIVAVHKALNKNEVPLKPKHVRALIVGTHRNKSSSIFWDTISRIQLEKNPIVSWKFCHLLHKLIRDGHPKVVEETRHCKQRIVQLGNFWQHLHTSSYGPANSAYCKLLVNRLDFLERNHLFPGSLHLSETQMNTLVNGDVNHSFEVSIEMLDQMDNLLHLQSIVFDAMGVVHWNSLTPQGQCLLAPLILVIVDASKFYDYLVKLIFKLHGQISPDALSGHRERFNDIFAKTKRFFELASNLQYFKYLVTIPNLPEQAPNFLRASDLEDYQTPQAVLHSDDVSESDTPPDGSSIADESLVDARARIEQYENRLQQVKNENDHYKQTLDELKKENDRLRAASVLSERHAVDETRLQDAEKRAQNSEQNFEKMKNAYTNLRQEHIQALKTVTNLQKELANSEGEKLNNEEAVNRLERKVAEIEQEKILAEEKAKGALSAANDLQGQLARCHTEIENFTKNSLEKLEELCLKLPTSSTDVSNEQLGALLEDEMKRMDEAIQKAVKMLEEMQKKSRDTDTGVRLEVNEKVLDSCNALMAAIMQLVAKSRAMQDEIVSLGRGTASPNEFYKRNHQWTEGLLSAAKAVGAAANVLVYAFFTSDNAFEFLIVASQEIAASTAQLFVSSRVKADRDSKRLAELASASKAVNSCTANVVATVKSGQQTLSDSQNLDFSHLSLHEAKKEEMESQVRTLELEADLMRERARFAALRKQHYHLASLVANEV